MVDFAQARHAMVESQIRTVKVTDDRILAALRNLPRELFVPEHLKSIAYVDEDLRISGERYMTEPMVLTRLLQAAEIQASDAVLVVGCNSGYGVALVSHLADTVVGMDDDADLVALADRALSALEIDNGVVLQGNMTDGYAKQAPYDVIVIEGRCGQIPEDITSQLANGGRLVTVGEEQGVGKAMLMMKGAGGNVGRRVLFDANITPLRIFAREAVFQF
ncbi:MAG: protein-L-isoaspartate O-methyltransferase [Rhodospirillaceae bacterium]|nr:protein-L-isoaspartate O-methyltransferase [Rhodospirillaceae bacterium]|tara:strand:+ start:9195 stop:9851 length:657 start_codon:yes stop_codon:yes gene_type:complete